jgi:hypothetical protein
MKPEDFVSLRDRARRAADARNGARSRSLYEQALRVAPGEHQIAVLHEMLDAFERLFEKGGSIVGEVVHRLAELAGEEEPRVQYMRGLEASRAARRLTKLEQIGKMEQAEHLLDKAASAMAQDSDAWGTLGGARRRLADYYAEAGRAEEAAHMRAKAIEAYAAGCRDHCDPYTTLNFIEERAISEPDAPFLRNEAERQKLVGALHARWREHVAGVDAPWPAFDLARGRYFLLQDLPSLFEDLRSAVHEAKKTSHYNDARTAVESTKESFKRLASTRPMDRERLEAAVTLLGALLHPDEWPNGQVFRAMVPETDHGRMRRSLDRLICDFEEANARTWNALSALVGQMNVELRADEERKFQEELSKISKKLEPTQVKVARYLWREAGEDLVKELIDTAGIPGAGLLAKILHQLASVPRS